RSGTEAVPSLAGLGAAARLARTGLAQMPLVAGRRDRLEMLLLGMGTKVSVNGSGQPRLPNTASVSFHGLAADAIVRALDSQDICASAGAACHSGNVEPSGTMRAMGLPLEVAMGAVRFSLSRTTTDAEIDTVAETVPRVMASVRQSTIV
ncbi:MAG: aminotransferase class V-fold PLP-dependent enzyme, partial [Thermoanaerobaculia bacterium]